MAKESQNESREWSKDLERMLKQVEEMDDVKDVHNSNKPVRPWKEHITDIFVNLGLDYEEDIYGPHQLIENGPSPPRSVCEVPNMQIKLPPQYSGPDPSLPEAACIDYKAAGDIVFLRPRSLTSHNPQM